jgi:hypothetical protein
MTKAKKYTPPPRQEVVSSISFAGPRIIGRLPNGTYKGEELTRRPVRAGALDAYALPSRINGRCAT